MRAGELGRGTLVKNFNYITPGELRLSLSRRVDRAIVKNFNKIWAKIVIFFKKKYIVT